MTVSCEVVVEQYKHIPVDGMYSMTVPYEVVVKRYKHTCGWYVLNDLALCSGKRTLSKNCLCSAFSGNANPLMILQSTIQLKYDQFNNGQKITTTVQASVE